MGINVIRLKLNSFLKFRNRLLKSPRIPEGAAELAMQEKDERRGLSRIAFWNNGMASSGLPAKVRLLAYCISS